MEFPDLMVDIETTGLDPSNTAMIQLAGVRFNYDLKTIGPVFNRSLAIPHGRYWDEGTRDWWLRDKAELLEEIMSRAEDPAVVLQDFLTFVLESNQTAYENRFWAKPSHFDYAFVQSYFNEFDVPNPFHYRNVVDMNSFFRGVQRNPAATPLDKQVEFDGTEHNALDDAFYQVKVVLMGEALCSAS